MAKNNKLYGVITGVIVGSSGLGAPQRKKLEHAIKKAVKKIAGYFPDALPFEADVFRGDSFQFLVARPEFSLRIALCFKLLLKSALLLPPLDARISIAVGKVSFISSKRISESKYTKDVRNHFLTRQK